MGCLKCGRDVQEGQIFCDLCLETMARFPVKSGTPVLLPKPREAGPPRKSSRLKLPPSPEEQVKRLRRRCRWFASIMTLLLALCIVLGLFCIRLTQDARKPLRGQNYSAMETSSETTAGTAAED